MFNSFYFRSPCFLLNSNRRYKLSFEMKTTPNKKKRKYHPSHIAIGERYPFTIYK